MGLAPLAEAQKTARLWIIKNEDIKEDVGEAGRDVVAVCGQPLWMILSECDDCPAQLFGDLCNQRACLSIGGGGVGDDACAYGEINFYDLTGCNCHETIADLQLDRGGGSVVQAELDRLLLGEHRVDRLVKACWCGVNDVRCGQSGDDSEKNAGLHYDDSLAF